MKTFLLSFALIAVTGAVDPNVLKSLVGGGGDTADVRFSLSPLDGSYQYAYQTADGTAVSQSGVGGELAEGTARWVAPDGTPVELSYRADAGGYVATGSHVPQTPEYVYRALEWIRSHPSVEDVPYRNPYSNRPNQYRFPPAF
ncbi:pupal cuticle protein-like [Phlebotomus papatasi]|uniref:Pupal cuticle protein n=1 Tax=Phlebotomus papatasi TaxID=29031 RepID=A0A1B0DCI7_PHLPP|nr:pupal cuticle protein-like [Phlebotomus papatasi]